VSLSYQIFSSHIPSVFAFSSLLFHFNPFVCAGPPFSNSQLHFFSPPFRDIILNIFFPHICRISVCSGSFYASKPPFGIYLHGRRNHGPFPPNLASGPLAGWFLLILSPTLRLCVLVCRFFLPSSIPRATHPFFPKNWVVLPVLIVWHFVSSLDRDRATMCRFYLNVAGLDFLLFFPCPAPLTFFAPPYPAATSSDIFFIDSPSFPLLFPCFFCCAFPSSTCLNNGNWGFPVSSFPLFIVEGRCLS